MEMHFINGDDYDMIASFLCVLFFANLARVLQANHTRAQRTC